VRTDPLLAAVALAALALLAAGCGGGGTTTVTVTETVSREPTTHRETTTPKEDAGGRQQVAKQGGEGSVGEEPQRIVHLHTFRSPTGNIGCVMYEGGARCDIRKRDWSPPKRPGSCSKQLDFGQGLGVSHGGEASFVCAGDTALDPGASSLRYGTASELGGAECISRSDGVVCVNQAGHGFFISIQSYEIF
jgi:hypothetical protein